ncbi:hypothetical protein LEP1GSC127_3355 [Leptospira kirschneri str. 200801925]|uniref:Uncharacterized protein n=1 Tax=Leptospira kirschneri str. 200802841 TaxID=1193047 RepID=A0A828Y1T8_9LEPT|nr:hypothetical protein [Leptospira kirschneri]EKO50763.1 hypothetical protein LEP1GSC131_3248 [Leptospira kirschneri str. 200802841]EMO74210.1 hypothetical protein LEP1GSC127_3355 [Leptospira kirschneri str. 200801925]
MKLRKTLICFVWWLFLFDTVACDIRDPNYKPFGIEVTRDPNGEVVFIVPKKGKRILTQLELYDLDLKEVVWNISNSSREWKTRFRYGENISKDVGIGVPPKKLIKGHRYSFGAMGNLVRGEEEVIEFVY